jgi:putative chitinase
MPVELRTWHYNGKTPPAESYRGRLVVVPASFTTVDRLVLGSPIGAEIAVPPTSEGNSFALLPKTIMDIVYARARNPRPGQAPFQVGSTYARQREISMSTAPARTLPLTLQTLRSIMPHAPAKYLQPLNSAMRRYGINTPKRVAGFLAQLAVESNELRHTHELWTARKNFQLSGVKRAAYTATSQKDYFEHWYGERVKGLGNVTAEDGYTYRGRGAIQITGKTNYAMIGAGIGQPLLTQPDLLETDASVNMLASAYYFARYKRLNHVADTTDPSKPTSVSHINARLTHAVNGGYNGLAERLTYFQKGLAILASG